MLRVIYLFNVLLIACSLRIAYGLAPEPFTAINQDNTKNTHSDKYSKVVLAGNPRIVPFNNIIIKSGTPRLKKANTSLQTNIPGQNHNLLPDVYTSMEEELKFDYPPLVKALRPQFRDGANRDVRCYGSEQGFAGGYTGQMLQDRDKRIWFAANKLICFDGTFFTHFRRLQLKERAFPLNTRAFIIDDTGEMYILNYGKKDESLIIKYDGGKFFRNVFFDREDKPIHLPFMNCLIEDNTGNLWIGTTSVGIIKYEKPDKDLGEGRVVHYTVKQGLPSNNIKCISSDKDGNIWIGTADSGMCMFEKASERFPEGRFIHYNTKDGLNNNTVSSIAFDDQNRLWAGTFGGGVNVFDSEAFYYLTAEEGLGNNYINDICIDSRNNIWIATHGSGVCKFTLEDQNKLSGSIEILKSPDNLISNHIVSIMEDADGCLWFGSFENGTMRYNPNSFKHITNQMGMEFNFPVSLIKDKQGNLWFGEERGGGLCKFDGTNFYYYTRKQGLCGDSVSSVIQDKRGNIWVATHGSGICKFDGNYFFHYNIPDQRNENYITTLLEDKNGNIWIGTTKNGAYKLDGQRFVRYSNKEGLCGNYINDMLEDRNGNIWFATDSNGVDRFDGHRFTNFSTENVLNSNKVVSLMEDHRGNIWFGMTGNYAIGIYNPEIRDSNNRFTELRIKGTPPSGAHKNSFDVLKYSRTKFLAQGHLNNFWLGTEDGIQWLISRNKDGYDSLLMIDFFEEDGLKGNNAILNSALVDQNNILWYGYNRAITYIDLNDLDPPVEAPIIQLQNIEFDRVFIDFRELMSQLNKDDEGTNSDNGLKGIRFDGISPFTNYPLNLSIPHHINHLEFNFSAINLQAPHRLKYRYKLKGADKNWSPLTAETRAIYTNLRPGSYTFMLKSKGAAEKWSDTLTYDFVIRPPWWLSWWAWSLYALLLIFLLIAWRRYDLRRLRLKQALAIEHLQTKKLAELDKMKSGFFANISHEFRTPLTLILGPIQKLLSKKNDAECRQDLSIMQRNARRLEKLINQILSLSKLEAGKMKLQLSEGNIVAMVRLFVQSFESYARQRQINLSFNSEKEHISLYFDRGKIEEIVNNLISNAFKHTGEGGEISINLKNVEKEFSKLSGEKSYVLIEVGDTGSGISRERLEHIFERFYQVNDPFTKNNEGSGIGLALVKELVELHHGTIEVDSEAGKGSEFRIYLPAGKAHFKDDEIVVTSLAYDKYQVELSEIEQQETDPVFKEQNINSDLPIVLIVEDNSDLRFYIRSFLETGYTVLEAVNGKDGLEKSLQYIPDLILSDIMMPEMDGNQLCYQLKNDERTSHIPIILLTARASAESKIEGLETGADDFITKPFDPQELKVRIKNLIVQRNKLKSLYRREVIQAEVSEFAAFPPMDRAFLEKAKKIVEQNMSETGFNVEDFASATGMSRVQLHRKLRALIDQSATEFVRSIRLRYAARLLKQKKGRIAEIAYDVGFSSPSYFSNNFTKQFGLSPKEYLQKYSESD
ncbi:MAG: response regulator [Bacteroidales bacterium]|nr:response regulator [Bacteroidales bacterium]MCF8351594.1 response regulator [Bacteroidales bacterium]MCF8375276.1 response regulator [Bacteroidales bacterium]MCF8401250.1 response regulator [Bacteroidales bacterium]